MWLAAILLCLGALGAELQAQEPDQPVSGAATEASNTLQEVLQDSATQEASNRLDEAAEELSAGVTVNYIDISAASVLLVFCVLGLFKGLIWQVSRIASLVAAYFAAGFWGTDVARLLAPMLGHDPASAHTGALPLYLAYVLLFVVALVILSLLTLLIQRFVDKTGMSFYDRLGGAALGAASGAFVMLAVLAGFGMFLPTDSAISKEAQASQTMRFSREVVGAVDKVVPLPTPVHELFGSEGRPMEQPEGGSDGSGASEERNSAEPGDTTGR